jgi:peptidoglycan/xylan/chitin deacetylase (PgdA/CDA1 family)
MIPMPSPWPERRLPDEFPARSAFADNVRQYCKRLPCDQVAQYLVELRKHPVREPLEEVYGFLSWDEVLALKSYGFDIASHTMEHPILVHLPRARLISELRDSKGIIEQRTGCRCAVFAYPNGGAADLSLNVVEEVRRAGYEFAFTAMGSLADPQDDPLLLDRIYVPGLRSEVYFEARVSGFHSVLKRSRIV